MTLKRLAVYYGYPSLVNGAEGDPAAAAKIFSQFDRVVLGANIEKEGQSLKPKHDDHDNTKAIIQQAPRTEFFGYINLGMTNTAQPHSLEEIGIRIHLWKEMGVKGIFFDASGFDFGVTRKRQNDAFQQAHKEQLKVFVNAHRPEDVFEENQENPKPALKEGDIFLFENFVISCGKFVEPAHILGKANQLKTYKQNFGVEILGIGSFKNLPALQNTHFDFLNYFTRLLDIDGLCMTEPNYSASNNQLFLFSPPADEKTL